MSSPNITYISNFYSPVESDELFKTLIKYPFKQPVIKVCGKSYRPLRKTCSYGDWDIEYEYSGHCEVPLHWNDTLLKIRSDMEKKTGFAYNFVLLNLYQNGYAKIGEHRDDEPCLDQTADIATLSFGASREMVFAKKGFESKRQVLESGSLLLMHDQEWTHAIPAQSNVKDSRISLTFRKITSSLEESFNEMEKYYSIPQSKSNCLKE